MSAAVGPPPRPTGSSGAAWFGDRRLFRPEEVDELHPVAFLSSLAGVLVPSCSSKTRLPRCSDCLGDPGADVLINVDERGGAPADVFSKRLRLGLELRLLRHALAGLAAGDRVIVTDFESGVSGSGDHLA